VLSNTKTERFGAIYEQLRALEVGETAPKGFCPAEDRKKLIKTWIEESKLNKQLKNNVMEIKKGANS
jgi:hypothetical protein